MHFSPICAISVWFNPIGCALYATSFGIRAKLAFIPKEPLFNYMCVSDHVQMHETLQYASSRPTYQSENMHPTNEIHLNTLQSINDQIQYAETYSEK